MLTEAQIRARKAQIEEGIAAQEQLLEVAKQTHSEESSTVQSILLPLLIMETQRDTLALVLEEGNGKLAHADRSPDAGT